MPALKNARHELFAQGVVKGLCGKDAYLKAGFTAKADNIAVAAASRLLATVSVQERVNELKDKAAVKAVLTREWVLERLMRNARLAMGEEPMKVKIRKPKSDEVIELEVHRPDAAAANKALELLGKVRELGLFVERVETGRPGEFAAMADDELRNAVLEEMRSLGIEDADVLGITAVPNVEGNDTQH